MASLKDKVVLITGASSGIGRAAAQVFAREGAKVVVSARRAELLHALVEETRSEHPLMAAPCDLTKEDQVKSMFHKVCHAYGKLDILINNAGIGLYKKVEEMEAEEWDRVMQTNLRGLFLCTREALKQMKRQGYGHIIQIASVVSRLGIPNISAYVASKHGVLGFHRSVKKELKGSNITTSLVCPGRVDTPFFDNQPINPREMRYLLDAKDTAEYLRVVAEGNVLKRGAYAGYTFLKRFLPL